MEWTEAQTKIGKRFNLAIEENKTKVVRELVQKHSWLVRDYEWNNRSTWMRTVGLVGHVAMAETLLDLGFNIDALSLPEKSSALSLAIAFKHWDLVCFLLAKGANPNLGRAMVSAINCEVPAKRLELVMLLVKHGADVNQVYDFMGDKDTVFTVLDWTEKSSDVYAYLKSVGAKPAFELRGSSKDVAATAPAKKTAVKKRVGVPTGEREVIDYFRKAFGPVDKKIVSEVIPTGISVTIHRIKPSKGRPHLTLFTTGLSQVAMQVPAGQEEYALAELFIQLPYDWNDEQLGNPKWNWPWKWLQKVSQYPQQNQTWLGGAAHDCGQRRTAPAAGPSYEDDVAVASGREVVPAKGWQGGSALSDASTIHRRASARTA